MWLNTIAYTNFELALCLIGSALWVAVYVEIIRNVHRNRFLEMPVFVVAGNFVWEGLYSWFYSDYINLGDLLLWGYRAWFLLDIYIVWLALRYGAKQFHNPYLQKHIKPIFFGLLACYLLLNWATIESGLDNMPLGGDGSVRLGGISAYVLNIIISVGYLYIYLRHRRVAGFSISTAWMKGVGTLCFSVFFAIKDSHNYLLLAMATIVAVLDFGYIYIRIRYPSLAGSNALSGTPRFVRNEVFEKLWEENPDKRSYYESHGIRLRRLIFDRWICDTGRYNSTYAVLEGNIVQQVSVGESSSTSITATTQKLAEVIQELELQAKDVYLCCNAMKSTPGDLDSRRITVDFFSHPDHSRVHMFLVAPRVVRAALNIAAPINPKAMAGWRTFADDESSFTAILQHFTGQQRKEASEEEHWLEADSNVKLRISELYTALDKIARNQIETVERIEVPDDDPFSEVFDALDLVMIDKRNQLQAMQDANNVLKSQSALISLEQARSEALLLNVLPPSIAERLKNGEKTIAEKLSAVSVLFADIVDFTGLSQSTTPEQLVEGLDRIFSEFDALAEKYGLEKIKTIGDAYMVVAGAPEPREDHAEAIASMAIEMLDAMQKFKSDISPDHIQLRIGIHSGEVVAGVIGKKKFAYDMWGDAVNMAARMESHGEAGKIHVSEVFANNFIHRRSEGKVPAEMQKLQVSLRGEMEIKGKGLMQTYFLEPVATT